MDLDQEAKMKVLHALGVFSLLLSMAGAGALAAQSSAASSAGARKHSASTQPTGYIAPGLLMPAMDPVRGKKLFASKGCVVCHSINGVGGTDAPKLDAATMPPAMNPFDFFAKMWRGAVPMIMMQQDEIGHQIEFTGQDLADIVAFVHNPEEQKMFSKQDIPPEIAEHMEEGESEGEGMGAGMMGGSGMGRGMMGGTGMGQGMTGAQPKQ